MDEPLSHRNSLIAETARLHRRDTRQERGVTILEGPNSIGDAVASGARLRQLFALDGDLSSEALAAEAGVDPIPVTERALARIAGTRSPRGPVAVVEIPEPHRPSEGDVVVLWDVSDPGNVGTLIRIAAAFGWDVLMTSSSADPWSPKVLRAGAGGHFRARVGFLKRPSELSGWTIVTTVVAGGAAPESVDAERVALVVGEEAAGLPDQVVAWGDVAITIPMPGGMESLNVAVAAGIAMYVLSGRRRARV